MILRDLADACLAALIAPPCAVCGSVLERPLAGAVCERCWSLIEPRGATFSVGTIRQARALGSYEGTLRDVLHAFKYDGRRSVARRLSSLMARHGADVLHGADCVVPVPLHPRRQRERGFNQAEDLARGVGLPLVLALKRARPTPPQVGLSADDRRKNVHDAFSIRRGRHGRYRVVVLIDDVTTTGATLDECARVLRAAGAREVRALTAARVLNGLQLSPRE